ncbi:hypothetical protein RIF29_16204 [Crotalaria pallida]|uniref:Uncharacterized protein n=1 Tax=Crotalaria pallida TaxID=3830 RepID=A0AAN9FEN9_CROPI
MVVGPCFSMVGPLLMKEREKTEMVVVVNRFVKVIEKVKSKVEKMMVLAKLEMKGNVRVNNTAEIDNKFFMVGCRVVLVVGNGEEEFVEAFVCYVGRKKVG